MRRGTSGINALIALDKPLGLTSHDCVARVRRALHEKRVGHAGTLDPDASGVLIVGIGQGTRLMGHLTAEHKGYLARISFGTETTTDDAEGEVTRCAQAPASLLDEAYAREVLKRFEGASMQVPPAYSAISVNGQRAYARARAGEEVVLEPRPIQVYSASLVAIIPADESAQALGQSEPKATPAPDAVTLQPSWLVSFDVSKGTYIRSLARDIGRSVDSAAHLSGLRRTFSGTVSLDSCITLDELEALDSGAVLERALDPVAALGLPKLELTAQQMKDVSCGKRLSLRDEFGSSVLVSGERDKVSLVFEGKLVGIWRRSGAYLVCDTNFPTGITGVVQ